MQIKNSLIIAISAAISSITAGTVNLIVNSENAEIDGNTLGFSHEGAGINYAFLGTAETSQLLEYDEAAKTFTQPGSTIPQTLGLTGNFVSLSVVSSSAEFTCDGDTLQLNGTSNNFYACKNVSDPYNYSQSQYALMYFADSVPENCLALTLVNNTSTSSSNSTLSSTQVSAPSASTMFSSSIFEGVADVLGPGSTLALIAAVVAALF